MSRVPFPTSGTTARVLVRCGVLAAASVVIAARARALDPTVGIRLETSLATSVAAGERLNVAGTNRTSAAFPRDPRIVWQSRLAPPIVGELATDDASRLLAAHGGDRVTALDARGRTVWSLRAGADLATGPLPLPGGRCFAVTREHALLWISAHGALEERDELPFSAFDANIVATPTHDGGALVAVGARFVRFGPRGTRGWEARLSDPVRALFDWRAQTVAVGHAGGVFVRGAAGDPNVVASFEEPVQSVALLGDRLIGAGKRALLEVDLLTKERRVLWADGSEVADFVWLGPERFRVATARAMLLDLEGGREIGRFALAPAEGASAVDSVVADRTSLTWLVTRGAPLVSITLQGDTAAVPGTGCPDPLRPTPLADGIAVAACRSGLLRALSDKER